MADLAEKIEATTKALFQSYVDCSVKKDASLCSAHLTSDCRRYIGPPQFLASVGAPPNLSFGIEEYTAHMAANESVWTVTSTAIDNLTIDVARRKAAATTVMTGAFVNGDKISKPQCWFLDFTEDGSKISKVYLVNDTTEAVEFHGKMMALMQASKET
jgi:hypothetical protein